MKMEWNTIITKKAEEDLPPNLRNGNNCFSCQFSNNKEGDIGETWCSKYKAFVEVIQLCDSYKEFK